MREQQTQRGLEIDAVWFAEWVTFGFREMTSYLAKHAAFDDWLERHPDRKEPV